MPLSRPEDGIATPEGKRRYVRTLFATIANRYDLITRLLSYGQDRRWKRRLIRMASLQPGNRALDLATGTGDIGFACARLGARVVGVDITQRMIELARDKALRLHRQLDIHFVVGDMLALPFPSASFDLVTTGYGLRNVANLSGALDEIRRVLKPGGRVLSLDFNKPSNAIVRTTYLAYLTIVGSALGWILHRDPNTYRYIPASIRQYPGAEGVVRLMQARGFSHASYRGVLGGLMAIHDGTRD